MGIPAVLPSPRLTRNLVPIAPAHPVLSTLLCYHPLRLDHGGFIISLSCRTPTVPDTYSLPSPTYLTYDIHLDNVPYVCLPHIRDCSHDVNPVISLLISSPPRPVNCYPFTLSFLPPRWLPGTNRSRCVISLIRNPRKFRAQNQSRIRGGTACSAAQIQDKQPSFRESHRKLSKT